MLGELLRDTPVGSIIFADNDTAGGVLVDAVDDPGTKNAVDPGQTPLAMIHDRVDKGTGVMTGGRVNDHILGLIDHQDVIVLIQDVQRNIFRENIGEHPDRQKNIDRLPSFDGRTGLNSFR